MKLFFKAVLVVMFSCVTTASNAEEIAVQTIALFNGKAMISVNGARAKIIQAGKSYKGVKLVSSNTDEAVVEIEGQRQTLTLDSGVVLHKSLATKAPASSRESAQIWADQDGFFKASGEINGQSLDFLVDTGANIVVLSSRDADRIALDYRDGQRTFATTASGQAPMYLIEVRNISFEGIEFSNIEVGIITGGFPTIPLLGMSFLENVDMTRTGNAMTLKKRF